MSTNSTVINLSNQQINAPCPSDSHASCCDYPMYLSETTQILKALAFASKPSGSGYRQKRKGSAGTSPSTSAGFSSDEEEPSQKRRKVPVVVSVEDSVAQYFANAIDSPGNKGRKMSMAERDLKIKESQANAMVDLLKSPVVTPGTKAAKIAVQKTVADTRLLEVETQAEAARLQADSMKANQAFTENMSALMVKLIEKMG